MNYKSHDISNYVLACKELLANCESGWQKHIAEISKMSSYYTKCAEQVDDKINSVLDEINSVLKGEYDIVSFGNVFKSMLKTLKIALVPTFLDCVFIGDLSSKFTGGKDLYIVGANTGLFPTESAGGAIITPKDEELFNSVGIELYPDEHQKVRNELFAVTELFKKPAGQIVVSYSETSQSGQMHPSTVIAQLQSMLTEKYEENKEIKDKPISVEQVVVDNFYKLKEESKSAKDELAKAIFSTPRACYHEILGGLIGTRAKLEDKDVYDAAFSALNYKATNCEENGNKDYVEKIKKASIDKLPERLNDNIEIDHTSVSRLETFYGCPYSYFLKYTLGLNRREEGEVKTTESGTIVHDVLENFFNGVKNKEVNEENAREYAGKKFEDAIKNMAKWDRLRNRHDVERLIDRLKTECQDTCFNLYKNTCHSKYQPFELEMEFTKDSDQRLSVEIDGKKIDVVGKIDRVDNYGDGFVIIDYKTYKSPDVKDEDLYTGSKLQLFVYAA
ncbi:MAG: PD-(D/E)XK nuclease family protein, partial [Clostridia bacterium]|nr:PD-(D/E)XK nuclease family protein [Clostridia bacterium]